MTKVENLSKYLASMKKNQLINHRECWACVDHIIRFHLEKMTDAELDSILNENIESKKYSHDKCPHPESLNKKCEEGITITEDYKIIPTKQLLEYEKVSK